MGYGGSFGAELIFSGGPRLMEIDADTVYLGRLVGQTWTDLTGGVTGHTVVGGGLQFSESNVPGTLSMYNGAGDYVESSAGGTDWKLTGDMSFESVVRCAVKADTPYVVWCGGLASSVNAVENAHYALGWASNAWRFVSESGVGVAAILATTNVTTPNQAPWFHFGCTRESDVVKIFVNGSVVATSGTLTTPDGGGNAVLRIGSAGVSQYYWDGWTRDVRISNVAKTDAAMLAAAQVALGA